MMKRTLEGVIIELKDDDFNGLLFLLGYAAGAAMKQQDSQTQWSFMRLANTINEGNPDWRRYDIPEGSRYGAEIMKDNILDVLKATRDIAEHQGGPDAPATQILAAAVDERVAEKQRMKVAFLFILKGHEVVAADDVLAWADWLEAHGDERVVGKDTVGEYAISTVFLGCAHPPFTTADPAVFETAIFRPANMVRIVARYRTWDDAAEGHALAVAEVTKTVLS